MNFVSAASDKRPDALKSVLFNIAISPKFIPSISLIRTHIKESGADVIVNFYELLGTVAYKLTDEKIPMVCVGHQFLFLHKDMHIPEFGYEGHLGLNLFSRAIYPLVEDGSDASFAVVFCIELDEVVAGFFDFEEGSIELLSQEYEVVWCGDIGWLGHGKSLDR